MDDNSESPEPRTYLTLGEEHNMQHPMQAQQQQQQQQQPAQYEMGDYYEQRQPQHYPSKPKNILLDQERFLPIANIARIMKKIIPSNGKIAKEAKQCVQECVSEFISFITSEAHDKCASERRKTITADDLLAALKATGFDNYHDTMAIFLTKYKELNKSSSSNAISNQSNAIYLDSQNEQSTATSHASNYYENQDQQQMPSSHQFNQTQQQQLNTHDSHPSTSTSSHMPQQTGHNQQQQQAYYAIPMSIGEEQQQQQQQQPNTSESQETMIIMNGDYAAVSQTPQTMQIYMDPTTKEYYVAMDVEGGQQLFPVTLQNGPNPDQTPQGILNAEPMQAIIVEQQPQEYQQQQQQQQQQGAQTVQNVQGVHQTQQEQYERQQQYHNEETVQSHQQSGQHDVQSNRTQRGQTRQQTTRHYQQQQALVVEDDQSQSVQLDENRQIRIPAQTSTMRNYRSTVNYRAGPYGNPAVPESSKRQATTTDETASSSSNNPSPRKRRK